MKRDMDIVRQILIAIEDDAESLSDIQEKLPHVSPDILARHVKLLWEGGFISGSDSTAGGEIFDVLLTELTWKGHEFLDAARNETIWSRARQLVNEKGGSVSMSVLQAILTDLALKTFIGP